MPLHEQERVQVHEVRLRCGSSGTRARAVSYLTHVYIASSEAFRDYILTDGTNNLATTESLDSTILHRINVDAHGHINHSFRSYRSPNISGLRGAGTSLAAVSNMVVILRISSNREGSTGLVRQSVRHGGDLQRRELVKCDSTSIGL